MVDVRLPLNRDEHATLVSRVKLISWLSLAYMGVEAVAGVYAGFTANSVALIGWGIDSMIEAVASLVIIWRFTGDRIRSDDAERTAQKVVAVSFFLLAPYVAVEATRQLITGTEPKASGSGSRSPCRASSACRSSGTRRSASETTRFASDSGEGTQNILCAYLSVTTHPRRGLCS